MNNIFLGKPPANIEAWIKSHQPTPEPEFENRIEFINAHWDDDGEEVNFYELYGNYSYWGDFNHFLISNIIVPESEEHYGSQVEGHPGYYWRDPEYGNYLIPGFYVIGADYWTFSQDPDLGKNGDITMNSNDIVNQYGQKWLEITVHNMFDWEGKHEGSHVTFTVHRPIKAE